MEKLTLEEAKNKVAKKNGFKSWQELLEEYSKRYNILPIIHERHGEQLAELYCQSQVETLRKENDELKAELKKWQEKYPDSVQWQDIMTTAAGIDPEFKDPELSEIIHKVHEDIEGRYDLTTEDLYTIHYLLCKLQ